MTFDRNTPFQQSDHRERAALMQNEYNRVLNLHVEAARAMQNVPIPEAPADIKWPPLTFKPGLKNLALNLFATADKSHSYR